MDLSLANEKHQMFTKLLRVTQTDQLLHQHKLDDFLELSVQGASLIMKLYTDIPVDKAKALVRYALPHYLYSCFVFFLMQ